MWGFRAFFAVVAACLAAGGFAACGGGSSSHAATVAARPAGFRGRFALGAKTRACLQRQGVTLPARRRGFRPGQRPRRANGAAPRFGRNSARFAKLRAALQKCGVRLPRPPGTA